MKKTIFSPKINIKFLSLWSVFPHLAEIWIKNIFHIDIQSEEKAKEVSLSLEGAQKPCGRMEELSKADAVNGKAPDASGI